LAALNGGLPEVVDKKLQQLQVSIDAKEYTRAIGAAAARVNVDGLPWASETEIRQLMLTRDLDADQAADMVATARKQKFQAGGMRIAKRREQVQGTPSFRNAPTSFSIAKPPKTFGELDGIISDAINKALDANLG
jgi:DNA-binding protein YbaB